MDIKYFAKDSKVPYRVDEKHVRLVGTDEIYPSQVFDGDPDFYEGLSRVVNQPASSED